MTVPAYTADEYVLYSCTADAYVELKRQEELVEGVDQLVASVNPAGDLAAHVLLESILDYPWQLRTSSETRVEARAQEARAFDEHK